MMAKNGNLPKRQDTIINTHCLRNAVDSELACSKATVIGDNRQTVTEGGMEVLLHLVAKIMLLHPPYQLWRPVQQISE